MKSQNTVKYNRKLDENHPVVHKSSQIAEEPLEQSQYAEDMYSG